jgi:hypothetical protein
MEALFAQEIAATTDYAMVLGKGFNADGRYVKVDIKGSARTFNVKDTNGNSTWNSEDDSKWNALAKGQMISYKLSGGKVSELTDLTASAVTKDVYSVSTSNKSIKIDGVWYGTDSDTVMYDFYDTTKAPIYIQLGDVAPDRKVKFAVDSNDIIDWLVIVKP